MTIGSNSQQYYLDFRKHVRSLGVDHGIEISSFEKDRIHQIHAFSNNCVDGENKLDRLSKVIDQKVGQIIFDLS